MNAMELLHEIVKTENEARALYEDAVRRREGLEEYLEKTRLELKAQYRERADAEIREHEKKEIAEADAEIKKHERVFAQARTKLEKIYESRRDDIARRMFGIVVGHDA